MRYVLTFFYTPKNNKVRCVRIRKLNSTAFLHNTRGGQVHDTRCFSKNPVDIWRRIQAVFLVLLLLSGVSFVLPDTAHAWEPPSSFPRLAQLSELEGAQGQENTPLSKLEGGDGRADSASTEVDDA